MLYNLFFKSTIHCVICSTLCLNALCSQCRTFPESSFILFYRIFITAGIWKAQQNYYPYDRSDTDALKLIDPDIRFFIMKHGIVISSLFLDQQHQVYLQTNICYVMTEGF